MKSEISSWRRNIDFSNDELSKKMDRLVELLKEISHSFVIEKIEDYQQLIIRQNTRLISLRKSIDEHEFRVNFGEIKGYELNLLILQHQSYRNDFEKVLLESIALTMKFNGFFVDQLNSIVFFNNQDFNSTSLQVSYR